MKKSYVIIQDVSYDGTNFRLMYVAGIYSSAAQSDRAVGLIRESMEKEGYRRVDVSATAPAADYDGCTWSEAYHTGHAYYRFRCFGKETNACTGFPFPFGM